MLLLKLKKLWQTDLLTVFVFTYLKKTQQITREFEKTTMKKSALSRVSMTKTLALTLTWEDGDKDVDV